MSYFKQITITDGLDNLNRLTPYGEILMAESVRIAGAVFGSATVDPNFWITSITGSGSVTQVNAEQILATGTTADSSASSTSTVVARFVASSQNRFLSAIRMGDEGIANNVRRWGPFNGTDGAYFKLDGTTLSACTMLGGVETAVPSTAWSGDQSVPIFTEINFFEVFYLLASVYFIVNGALAHAVFASPLPWTGTPHLPAHADNINSGGSADVSMYLRDIAITRLGRLETQPIYGHITTATTTVFKHGPGLLHRIAIGNPGGTKFTVYDNIAGSGSVITSFSTPSQANPFVLEFGVVYSNGLTVVSTGTWDATVVYE